MTSIKHSKIQKISSMVIRLIIYSRTTKYHFTFMQVPIIGTLQCILMVCKMIHLVLMVLHEINQLNQNHNMIGQILLTITNTTRYNEVLMGPTMSWLHHLNILNPLTNLPTIQYVIVLLNFLPLLTYHLNLVTPLSILSLSWIIL